MNPSLKFDCFSDELFSTVKMCSHVAFGVKVITSQQKKTQLQNVDSKSNVPIESARVLPFYDDFCHWQGNVGRGGGHEAITPLVLQIYVIK